MSQHIANLGTRDQQAATINTIRYLRAGGDPKGVYLGNALYRAVLQEVSGVDLGAEPLPGGVLTATDLLAYEQRAERKASA